ncbi:linoleate diol synthase [Abortiporus biennis]|nr:linoleate diol synthase [Abortiporus biennis]
MSTLSNLPSKLVQRASSYASGMNGKVAEDEEARSFKAIDDFRASIKKGSSYIMDISALSGIVDALRHNNAIDDRKMLLEHVLVFLSRLPEGTLSQKLQNAVVELLYNDLPHPPSTYIGNEYAWRAADGSRNNICDPDMGKAGTPYARSVQQSHPLPKNQLPDAGLVFDTLLKREKFVKHPAGLSSMMFSFAALVIHTVFRTSHDNVNVNETSSYIDLAPLYGCNQEGQDQVRLRDGRGLLHPDTFAEDRLLLLPPAVCVLLVLFNRNHNYIAKKLLEINERGTYIDPDSIPMDEPTRQAKLFEQEEELFQTARLINCTWFASAVFSDYFSAILGLVRQGNSWSLNPFGEIRQEDHTLFERGRGNVCSVEFNCLYRWHATTSVEDEQWVHEVFEKIFPGKAPDELSIMDFKNTAKKLQASLPDMAHWTFGNLQRGEDGRFKDEDLARILHTQTEHPAGAFKARGTPHIMRLHEIMGIEQNRRWGVCSLNDFRAFLGLKRYSTFLEWNSDPEIASAAEKLYGDIELLELYVGLQAEEAKPVVDGAGLCPSYTISRAILSDAIALCRGDRFYTADYTPFNMTSWGFADCQRDPTAPGYGSTLGRLFLRTLPNHFSHNSSYTWFPLMTPEAMKGYLTDLGDIHKYDLKRPGVVKGVPRIGDYQEVVHILRSPDRFTIPDRTPGGPIVKGQGFFIASKNPKEAERDHRAFLSALTGGENGTEKIVEYFYHKTRELMLRESYALVGSNARSVDLARDVLKYVPIYWVCEVAGIPLKTKRNDDGAYTVKELYEVLTDIYGYFFLDVDPAKILTLHDTVKSHVKKLLGHIKASLTTGTRSFSIAGFIDAFYSMFKTKSERDQLMDRLSELAYDQNTLANCMLALMVGSTVEMSQSLTHLVNFFLDDAKPTDVKTFALQDHLDTKQEQVLQSLVMEALRLDPAFSGVYRAPVNDEVIGGVKIIAGQRILVDISAANLDTKVFPQPKNIDPIRSPKERYLVGDGCERCLGHDLSTRIMSSVLLAVFGFPKIRRGPTQSGQLHRFKSDTIQTSNLVYLGRDQKPTPWTTSMVVQFN